MKKITLLFLISLFASTLFASALYIKVASVTRSDALFSLQYELESRGYSAYITQSDEWFRVYTGPFKNQYEAKLALKRVQQELSRDAYITQLTIENSSVLSTPVAKQEHLIESKNIEVQMPKEVQNDETFRVAVVPMQSKQEALKKETHSSELSKIGRHKSEKNYYVGFSLGASKFNIKRSGDLPLDILMRSYGPSYGFEGGYYIDESLFVSLAYQNTQLRYSSFDAAFVSLNYQPFKVGTLSPYVGVLVGMSRVEWSQNPVNNANTLDRHYSAIGGFTLGGDVNIYDEFYGYVYYRYIGMDFKSIVTQGASSSEITHTSQQDFNLGLKYKF